MSQSLGDMKLDRVCVLLLLLLCCTESRQAGPQELQAGPQELQAGPQVLQADPHQAKGFLNRLRRPRRNIWDRSRPDVQQWILQYMSLGYDEARLEADLSYWRDQWRSSDQGRQHHYDENAAVGPQDASSYRHGANVNYDYY